jgi:hypothetical protein
MAADTTIAPADVLLLSSLLAYAEQGIASRVLAKNGGGSVTLFAFDTGQGLSEHTAPFDALVFVLEGSLILNIGGKDVTAVRDSVVRMPADVPHTSRASLCAVAVMALGAPRWAFLRRRKAPSALCE